MTDNVESPIGDEEVSVLAGESVVVEPQQLAEAELVAIEQGAEVLLPAVASSRSRRTTQNLTTHHGHDSSTSWG